LITFNPALCAANSSVSETRIKVDHGDGLAQFDLGRMYYCGDGFGFVGEPSQLRRLVAAFSPP
jgi:hypothetical protein